eukprot:scaffold54500_cov65-Phaeocystis_antarctica.AAC.1
MRHSRGTPAHAGSDGPLGAPRRARIGVVRVARAVSRRGRPLRPGRPLPLRGRDGAVGGAGALAWRFACVRGSGA